MQAEQQTNHSSHSPDGQPKRPSRAWQYAGLSVMAVMVGLTAWNLFDPEDNPLPALRGANGWFLLLGLLFVLFGIVCEGWTMQLLLRPMGRKIRFGRAFTYANNDYYFSAVTPASLGGDPFTVYYMYKDGIEIAKSWVMFLSLMIVYTAALVSLGVAAALLFPAAVFDSRTAVWVLFLVGAVVNLLFITISAFLLFSKKLVRRAGYALIRLGARTRILKHPERNTEKFDRSMEDYKAGARYMRSNFWLLFRIFIICIVQRLVLMMVTWCVYRSFGLTGVSFLEITALQAIVNMSVSVLPLPGGVGPAEQMFFWLFAGIFWDKLMPGLILSRGIAFYFTLIFSGIVTLSNHIAVKRRELQLRKGEKLHE